MYWVIPYAQKFKKPSSSSLCTMIVLKFGGSIVNPDGKYDDAALQRLGQLIQKNEVEQFCVIIGGGKVCRQLQQRSLDILKDVLPERLLKVASDEVGIAATKINAHYVIDKLKPIFGDEVCPHPIIELHSPPPKDYRVYVSCGVYPGHSTDLDMMVLARLFGANRAVKITDFPVVLDAKATDFDKENAGQYQPLFELSWSKLHELVGDVWVPGAHYPFDPIATQIGKQLAFKGFTLCIGQHEQLEAMVSSDDFKGSVVKGR